MDGESTALSDPRAYGRAVPYREFARRRREAPVAWVDEPLVVRRSTSGATAMKGTGYWAVTRHAGVSAAARAPDVFSSAAKGVFLADPVSRADLETNRELLISMDPPRHTAVRRAVRGAFTPRAVRRLSGSVQAHARGVAGQLLGAARFDAVRDLAAELPLLVLADLLGIPRTDRSLLYTWSNNLVGFDDPDFGGGSIDVYRRTFTEAFTYALDLARAKRRNPRDDLISRLVTGDDDGRRLTESEFCNLWILLVVAGNETTRNLISGCLRALAEHPAERDRLLSQPRLVGSAVEEMLRWVTPIMQFRRTATRDTALDSQAIRAGDKVVLYFVSANRDAQVFADPDRLDIGRNPNPHLAFGVGQHFCLGAHLARLELATLLEVLLPHLPRLRLTGPVLRTESNFMNAIKSMPARFAS